MDTARKPIASSELATLWIAYQKKTMMVQVTKHFLAKSQDPGAIKLLQDFHEEEKRCVDDIKQILEQGSVAIPIGFTENDVNHDVGPLFDDIYHISYLRMMAKIATGLHALHMTMTYRKDILELYKNFTVFAEETYIKTSQYLLEKGVLPKSPAVTPPKQVEFAKEKDYRAGFKPMGQRRSLNTIEVAYLYQGIEANITGMKLMTGFSQVAQEREVKDYFIRGKNISKDIINTFSKMLLDSDIVVPATSGGRITDSTMSPFSDKLMMYNTSILTSFGLGSNALGTSFSLRKDLPLKMAKVAKNVYDFATDGGDLMIKYGWAEEPPQMEDRTALAEGEKT
ncbi:Protein of unknown function [Halobacillus dabanensis]|uniref:DUF3231 family protein n=1 Tax=Halobacillus dabanensis TaxID=240302 RepID=A0A1I3WCW6_HALDA|nr:DUF3231 family protein [Halobacillus dabanensis]SFK05033.1 Protein of unknown function [Halobacillus dabanensis]